MPARKNDGNTYTDRTGKFAWGNPGRPKGSRNKHVMAIDPEKAVGFLQGCSDIREAWQRTLAKMGNDGEKMASAGPPPSPMFEVIENPIPYPNMAKAEMLDSREAA